MKSFKPPRSLSIAGMKWDVEVKDKEPDSDEVCYGETDVHERKIVLYPAVHKKYSKASMRATLFHECLHAALTSTGAVEALTGKNTEELIVTALENALWPLIEAGVFK